MEKALKVDPTNFSLRGTMCYDIHEYEDLMEELKQLRKIKKAEKPVEAPAEILAPPA